MVYKAFRLYYLSDLINMPFKFKNLKVCQKAVDLADNIDRLTKAFPKDELFVLTSQIKRTADSVSLNIAEGSTGQSNAEFKRFIVMLSDRILKLLDVYSLRKEENI